MGRGCCEGATGLCNCLVRSASPNVTVTQPEQGVYDITVVDGAVADICASLQGLTDANRALLASDQIVAVDASNNCVRVDATTAGTSGSLPAGLIMAWPGGQGLVPAGFIICDGRQLPQASYPALFNALGTGSMYGTNGTNFYIPDLRARTIQGANGGSHVDGAAGGSSSFTIDPTHLPDHVHGMSFVVTSSGESKNHVHGVGDNADFFMTNDPALAGFGGYGGGDYGVNAAVTSPASYAANPQYHTHEVAVNGTTNATAGANNTAITFRPEHIAMNWIIKS